ncbi:MAG: hypothetical protein M3Y87_20150, partial [Myxococcota bacterium]|nr:hypothetical protein [Myxococcota bacterium]
MLHEGGRFDAAGVAVDDAAVIDATVIVDAHRELDGGAPDTGVAPGADAGENDAAVSVETDAGGDPDAGSPLDPSVVGEWAMDTIVAGTVVDTSGRGHDAICSPCPTVVAGRVGDALELDGTTYLRIPAAAVMSLTAGFTIAAWLRPERDVAVDDHRAIVTQARSATTEWNTFALFHWQGAAACFETY